MIAHSNLAVTDAAEASDSLISAPLSGSACTLDATEAGSEKDLLEDAGLSVRIILPNTVSDGGNETKMFSSPIQALTASSVWESLVDTLDLMERTPVREGSERVAASEDLPPAAAGARWKTANDDIQNPITGSRNGPVCRYLIEYI
jgi:hypothetical protein